MKHAMNQRGVPAWIALITLAIVGCGDDSQSKDVTAIEIDRNVESEMQMGTMDTVPSIDPTPSAQMPADTGSEPEPMETPNDAPEPQVMTESLDRAYEWLIGRFDSREQAITNPAYFSIQLTSCAVNAPELGERVLYVEQATMDAPSEPYRQRLYVLTTNQRGQIVSTIYSLNQPQNAVGLCDRDTLETFGSESVTIRQGCAVYLDWTGDAFVGSTRDDECVSSLRGASYATSEVKLYADRMESWDQDSMHRAAKSGVQPMVLTFS